MSKDVNSDKPRIGVRHRDGVEQIIASRWKIGAALAIAVLLCLSFLVLLPLADGIVLGLVFAYIGRPIQLKFKERRKLGALVASLCIFIPLVFIIGVGILEILNQVTWILDNKTAVTGAAVDFIHALNIPQELVEILNDAVRNLFASLLPAIGSIGLIKYAESVSLFVINFMVSIILCFYILADGDRLYSAFLGVMPSDYKEIVNRYACHLDLILRGIFLGSAYSAIIVSVTSVVVFYAFGFPHVLALATLIFIASVIPLFAGYMVLYTPGSYALRPVRVRKRSFFLCGCLRCNLWSSGINPEALPDWHAVQDSPHAAYTCLSRRGFRWRNCRTFCSSYPAGSPGCGLQGLSGIQSSRTSRG